MTGTASLQETHAPSSICFGCGPANEQGLRIRSMPPVDGDPAGWVTAEWVPSGQHAAFPGMLSGGITGTLLDCHSNWTAAWHLMVRDGLESPPCTVTAEYAVSLRRPIAMDQPVLLRARVVESQPDRATVEAELVSGDKVAARCRGTFVAVKPGHPAYHRWG